MLQEVQHMFLSIGYNSARSASIEAADFAIASRLFFGNPGESCYFLRLSDLYDP